MAPSSPAWRGLRTLAGAGLAVVLALLLSSGTPASPSRQTVLQFNLCGNACTNGGLAVVTAAQRLIVAHGPLAVTLNEVCENQYAQLTSDLPAYQGRFDPTGPRCHNGKRFGNVVLLRGADVRLVGSWLLPNPAGDENRRLLCVGTRSSGGRPLDICVTHISQYLDNVGPQVRAVATILNGLRGHAAVLFAGDLNTDPADARLDPLYSACYHSGAGHFHEAGSPGCGERRPVAASAATFQRHKFDYVFLSDGDWSDTSESVVPAPAGLSDHHALWAAAALTE